MAQQASGTSCQDISSYALEAKVASAGAGVKQNFKHFNKEHSDGMFNSRAPIDHRGERGRKFRTRV